MQVCYNGDFFPAHQPLITIQSPAFKWGDGLFETMRVYKGRLLLASLHFERLFGSMALLQLQAKHQWFEETIRRNITRLCAANNCAESARVRLSVFRSGNKQVDFTIEATPLDADVVEWKPEGINLTLFPHARKAMDDYANLKSCNYLIYRMAAAHAVDDGVDDALVLNTAGAVCDSSKANIFLVKDETLFTPALHQGCIAGVLRRVVIEKARALGYVVEEGVVPEKDLLAADEVFLTNAVQTLRWVRGYASAVYTHRHSKRIFDAVSSTIES